VTIVILATQRGRSNSRALFVTSGLIVGGVVLNRLNTTLFSWWSYTSGGPVYIPTLSEIVGSVALVSIGVVAFGLIAKNFPVFTHEQHAQAPAE
jgi:Ni/Fe-hydrogenase subunit HybB-like protein